MKTWATAPEADAQAEAARAPWDLCYVRLKEEVRLRQYSPKRLSTYATWIRQFQGFLENKNPSDISSDDAIADCARLDVRKAIPGGTVKPLTYSDLEKKVLAIVKQDGPLDPIDIFDKKAMVILTNMECWPRWRVCATGSR